MNEFLSTRVGKISILTLLALLAFLYFKYCRQSGEKPPPQITITDAVKAPVAVAFIDANRFLSTQVPKAKVTLHDPNGMVVSSNGVAFSTIEVTGGVMSLALKRKAEYTVQNPYVFTLKVEMEGYSSNVRNIIVTSDEGQYVPIFMSSLENPAAGMATVTGTINLVNGVVKADTMLAPTKTNGISSKNIGISVSQGTQPIFCDRNTPGKTTPKKLNYRISYASPRKVAAGRTFPGGPLIINAVGLDGNPFATPQSPIYFTSQGWINIDMDADNEPVSSFSKPLSITLPIDDSLINPLSNPARLYEAKDVIPIWSLSDKGVWTEEGKAVVEGTKGNLYAKMTVTHLSTWNLDCTANPCASPAQDLTVNYVYNPPAAGSLSLYSEIVRYSDGFAYGITGLGTNTDHILTYNSGGGSFTIARTPNGERLVFVAYDNTGAPGVPPTTGALAQTTPFVINCAGQPNPTITIPPAAQRQQVKLKFIYDIDDDSNPATPNQTGNICSNAIWYKKCNGGAAGTDCDPTTANVANYCVTKTPLEQLVYGGITDKGQGTVTFYKVSPNNFNSVHCIRLWYVNAGVSDPIDFPIDFSVQPTEATAEDITGKNNAGSVAIKRWYNAVDGTHYIKITNGITSINACI